MLGKMVHAHDAAFHRSIVTWFVYYGRFTYTIDIQITKLCVLFDPMNNVEIGDDIYALGVDLNNFRSLVSSIHSQPSQKGRGLADQ